MKLNDIFSSPQFKALRSGITSDPFPLKERDTQRHRVYKSDTALMAVAKPLPTVEEVERYVKRVFGMKRIQAAFPSCRTLPQVKDGRGRRKAGGSSTMITIPLWARNEAVVLHELAHTICQRTHGRWVAGHGWQYASIYLTLVLHAMGREAHDVLKAAFKANRVRYTAPRVRKPMDPARKAELVARLAAYRAAQKETAPVMRPEPL
jgi:putative metallohydrolase (TIGR04338 family)